MTYKHDKHLFPRFCSRSKPRINSIDRQNLYGDEIGDLLSTMLIREEIPSDFTAINEINDEAFKSTYESVLVNQLRSDGLVAVSLVAVDEDSQIPIGHILFSELEVVVDGRMVKSVSLAPMAVQSSHQKQGIGSALIRKGLDMLKKKGYSAVIVLGHQEYYPKFGFSHQLVAHLSSPFQDNEHFMGLEFISEALSGQTGTVKYPPAFGIDKFEIAPTEKVD